MDNKGYRKDQLRFYRCRFYLFDTGKDIRFVIVVSIGSHAQINFLGICVFLEGLSDAQNCIWWAQLNMRPPRPEKLADKRDY